MDNMCTNSYLWNLKYFRFKTCGKQHTSWPNSLLTQTSGDLRQQPLKLKRGWRHSRFTCRWLMLCVIQASNRGTGTWWTKRWASSGQRCLSLICCIWILKKSFNLSVIAIRFDCICLCCVWWLKWQEKLIYCRLASTWPPMMRPHYRKFWSWN